MSAAGWPLCVPVGPTGWLALGHRFAVAFASVMMLWLLLTAWKNYREQRVLLPLVTVTATLFFGEALIGAAQASGGYPMHLMILHGFTAISLWLGLGTLALVSVLRSPVPVDYPAFGFRQRFKDFLALTKPVVVLLLLATTLTALLAGWGGSPPFNWYFGRCWVARWPRADRAR